MRQVAAYTEIRAPRWGKEENERTLAKSHPPYVYGTSNNACLIHKIRNVEIRWWTCGPSGEYLVRLQSPRLIANTNCSLFYPLDSTKAKSCAVPDPNAVLCGRCHGEGVNFPHGKPHKVSKQLAKIRKGCMAEVSA